ncbi:MAG: ABC transporter substrate-binding protein [Lachnospiraceae bacterium]
MKKMNVLLSLLLVSTMLAACSGNTKTEPTAAPQAAESDTTTTAAENTPAENAETVGEAAAEITWPDLTGQTVVVYNCSIEEELLELGKRFEAATGGKVESIQLSAGEALGRISVEKENPKAGVWYIGGVDSYISAKKDGLLEQYSSPTAANFSDQFKDKDGYYTGVTMTYLVISYNQTLLDELGLEVPASWQDLLDPAYAGQITMASPATSGTAYTFLSTICQLYGEEEGIEYMKALDANVKSYEKSGSSPSRLCAQGEAAIAITYFHDVTNYREQGFDDFLCVIPSEGTGYEMGCTALVKGGPSPEASKAFIDFILMADNQEVAISLGYHSGRTNPDTKPSELVEELLTDAPVIEYDAEWSGENRERLIGEWAEAVGQ